MYKNKQTVLVLKEAANLNLKTRLKNYLHLLPQIIITNNEKGHQKSLQDKASYTLLD